eukprot:CAMPEP_0119208054 /NCGR_PEP_ID=MMETSP1327-20130426/370_1 /TAXON_ID=38833 /ORGANISM="Micromonas pusilla, Strain RCC2306" /LENGTH=31 /DNA_ID= /DNA_START= /DNA_END= /DNA_ORIENTATION=
MDINDVALDASITQHDNPLCPYGVLNIKTKG